MARMAEPGMSVLPGSVVASHLEASGVSLVHATRPDRVDASVGTAGELSAIVTQLVAGQRHVAAALAQLSGYVRDRRLDGDLAEVLLSAAEASGHSADALAEAGPLLQLVLDVTGADTRL
jgi:hypothetical protein